MSDYPIINKLVEKLLILRAAYPNVDDANLLKMMELEIRLKEAARNR